MSGPTQFKSVLFKEQNCIGLSASLNGSSTRSWGSESDQPLSLNKIGGNWTSHVALAIKKLPANEGDIGDAGSIQERAPGEGNDNPLQRSCLENPMDRRIWWATIHGIAKIQTQLGMQYFLLFLQQSVSQWLSLYRFPGSPHAVK